MRFKIYMTSVKYYDTNAKEVRDKVFYGKYSKHDLNSMLVELSGGKVTVVEKNVQFVMVKVNDLEKFNKFIDENCTLIEN